uniref:Uncharacterized protein n=1 Tax=Anopheles christyi TaxID=43041 RepID=A0A182KIA0_9DIPT
MYWKSAKSPPIPSTVLSLMRYTRSTSWNRASEPYEISLSAAMITPSLNINPTTDVPVVTG